MPLIEKELDFLKNLNEWCRDNFNFVWSIPFEEGEFLYFLLKSTSKKSILEIGTSYGFSTCWLGLAAKENQGKVTSLEVREDAVESSRKNLATLNLQENVDVVCADAFEFLKKALEEKKQFDFVFLDSHKREYLPLFKLFYPLLSKNAIIVADNIISHANGTKDYVDFVKNNPKLFSTTNPIGNGIELTIKLG